MLAAVAETGSALESVTDSVVLESVVLDSAVVGSVVADSLLKMLLPVGPRHCQRKVLHFRPMARFLKIFLQVRSVCRSAQRLLHLCGGVQLWRVPRGR